MEPTSISQLNLAPIPGKQYTTFEREWREEFIYFLMVDRFHDSAVRHPQLGPGRRAGFAAPDNAFYGGTIKGVTQNLDYIAGLGCTAIWLSPVFENTKGAYHGYSITNYLAIDPNFGTKADLVELVDKAHHLVRDGKPWPMRIILDVVTNHSGDVWGYKNEKEADYDNDRVHEFGGWRTEDRPVPVELRDIDLYHRRGRIRDGHWDDPRNEVQRGDMFGLKDFNNDDEPHASKLIDILIKAHCYWIREADVDGFRVDAIKHMSPEAVARFSSGVREYAYSLGKRRFFLFGELASGGDRAIDQFVGPNAPMRGSDTVFFGIDSVLDFVLAPNIRRVIKGEEDPAALFNRLQAQNDRALNRGELGRYLMTFADNHDYFWQKPDGRIANGSDDGQVIGAVGFLLCALGTSCIYYGTEQGFDGNGGDNRIREGMFLKNEPGRNLMNRECRIYQEIAKIALAMRGDQALRFGRMYYRKISGNGVEFGLPFGSQYTLAFSRVLAGNETVVAYNVSAGARRDAVAIDRGLHKAGDKLTYLYGGVGEVAVEAAPDGELFVRLPLDGHRFAILK